MNEMPIPSIQPAFIESYYLFSTVKGDGEIWENDFFFKAYISSAYVLSLYGPVGNTRLGYTRGHLMLCSHDSVLSIGTPV